MSKRYISIIIGAIALAALCGVGYWYVNSAKVTAVSPIVATVTPTLMLSLTPSPTASPSATPTLTPKPGIKLSKRTYTIALYGDSMIDTMADHSSYLITALKEKYPGTEFIIYNYGIGAQNIADGVARWESQFSNRGRVYPPITEIKPDVIVIGSFSYNPFSPHDKDRHKALLSQLVQKAKATGAKVYMLAEIAPLGPKFGLGPKGVNWTEDVATEHSRHIIEQINNVYAVASEENVGVVDAFHNSKASTDEFGTKAYVNPDDGIHPSTYGHQFISELMATVISLK